MKVHLSSFSVPVLATCFCLLMAPPASAASFAQRHPRRAEVNHRERHQQLRIANGIRNGSLSPAEVRQIESQEAAVKRQERREVRANGGYLTRGQDRQLNRELNGISRDIYQDKHN